MNYRLIVLLRAIPTGASPFEAFPSAEAGVRVTSAPAFPPLRHRKRRRRPQGLLPQLSPLRPVGVTRPSARCSLGLSCSSSEGCGVPQSTDGPGKPGRQLPAGWNCETARRPSLPECVPHRRPGWGSDRLGCPRTEVQGARRPRVIPHPTEVVRVLSRCGCTLPACLRRPTCHRGDLPSAEGRELCSCSWVGRACAQIPAYRASFRVGSVPLFRLPASFPRESCVMSGVRSGPRGVSGPREGLRRR